MSKIVPTLKYSALSDGAKKINIEKYHLEENISILELASRWDTYPNKITRDCKRLGIKYRNKSEAQKVALATGKVAHPTKGKERTDEEKAQIGDARRESWGGLSEAERAEISEQRKRDYKPIGNKALRVANFKKASTEGSKLEKFLYESLKDEYLINMHKELLLKNDRMHVDLYLPKLGTCVEVDGPAHFQNLFSNSNVLEVKEKDARKSGLILHMGLKLIRVINDTDFTLSYGRSVLIALREQLEIIKANPGDKSLNKVIYIKV